METNKETTSKNEANKLNELDNLVNEFTQKVSEILVKDPELSEKRALILSYQREENGDSSKGNVVIAGEEPILCFSIARLMKDSRSREIFNKAIAIQVMINFKK